MPPAHWPLHKDRPVIQVVLSLLNGGQYLVRRLVADTGAGSRRSIFELVLTEKDCLQGGGLRIGRVKLRGAYSGTYPQYVMQVRIAQLNFDESVAVVAVKQVPQGFDGIAGFKFLDRFHYGNFGKPASFGLDLLPGS